jgi:hypothetical protein
MLDVLGLENLNTECSFEMGEGEGRGRVVGQRRSIENFVDGEEIGR